MPFFLLIPPPPPPLMAMGSGDQESGPHEHLSLRPASAFHASLNPSPLPAVCGDWSMVFNAPRRRPVPAHAQPGEAAHRLRPPQSCPCKAPRPRRPNRWTGWNPDEMGPSSASRRSPGRRRCSCARADGAFLRRVHAGRDSTELDLWGIPAGELRRDPADCKPPPPRPASAPARSDRPTAFVGADGTGMSARRARSPARTCLSALAGTGPACNETQPRARA